MGNCGCGNQEPVARFRGPVEKWWVVTIYPGCHSCNNPAGVFMDLLDAHDVNRCGYDSLPELEGDNIGVPIIKQEALFAAVFNELDETEPWADAEKRDDALALFDADGVVRRAVYATAEAWTKYIKKRKASTAGV